MTKPAVAFVLEEKARTNLERKIKRLLVLVEQGGRAPDIPTSLRRFNAWESAGEDTEASFHRNANETLARYPALREAAVEVMLSARQAAKPPIRVREAGVNRARERARLHLSIRQIAEAELVLARSEIALLRREIEGLRAQANSMGEEVTKIREAYEVELSELRERNAKLLRAVPAKVKVIRGGD